MAKIAHTVDAAGVFSGTREWPIDPLETEVARKTDPEAVVYMANDGYVEKAPPKYGDKEIPVWDGSAWSVQIDHRGEVWYRGIEPVYVDVVGDPAQAELTPEPDPAAAPVVPPTAAHVYGLAYQKIEAIEPEWAQRSRVVRMLRLVQKYPAGVTWSVQDAKAWTASEDIWDRTAAIWAAAEAIAGENPIPDDYDDPLRWP